MIITDFTQDMKCRACNHFGYCLIYWGAECKRQGGYRTPRLKKSKITAIETAIKQKATVQEKIHPSHLDTFEPIRTRRVNW